jgi:hypothetical protein
MSFPFTVYRLEDIVKARQEGFVDAIAQLLNSRWYDGKWKVVIIDYDVVAIYHYQNNRVFSGTPENAIAFVVDRIVSKVVASAQGGKR